VLSYEARFDRYRPEIPGRWRDRDEPGSGVLYDLGSHLIDQALVLFGMPDWVHADLAIQREGARAVDTFHVTLAIGSLRVELGASMLALEPGPRFIVHGRNGSFIKAGMDVQEDQLKAGLRPGDPGFGEEPRDTWPIVALAAAGGIVRRPIPAATGAYLEYYRGIGQAIETGVEPPVLAEEARAVVRVIEAAMMSNREGRRVGLSEGA
jgi:scyllo-inositol 2-dehydrogenase (NADP+)